MSDITENNKLYSTIEVLSMFKTLTRNNLHQKVNKLQIGHVKYTSRVFTDDDIKKIANSIQAGPGRPRKTSVC
jgi:hypothetical protein